MSIVLTDKEIDALVEEEKLLPAGYLKRLTLKSKRGHKEAELPVRGKSGAEFVIILRQSSFNVLDFSAILAYKVPGTNRVFRLRRYNGKHAHTNKLEGTFLDDFHIHQATERYQTSGLKEDAYADSTPRYASLTDALGCLVKDCGGVVDSSDQQAKLPFASPVTP